MDNTNRTERYTDDGSFVITYQGILNLFSNGLAMAAVPAARICIPRFPSILQIKKETGNRPCLHDT